MNQTTLRHTRSSLVLNPPSSLDVLQRLQDRLAPPLTVAVPTRRQVRNGAYDRLHARCIAEAEKPDPALTWAYDECTRVIRLHSKSFYLSARLLPARKRDAVMSLYAFCRVSDDIVDETAATSFRSLSDAGRALD
jgi:hypothetical protein